MESCPPHKHTSCAECVVEDTTTCTRKKRRGKAVIVRIFTLSSVSRSLLDLSYAFCSLDEDSGSELRGNVEFDRG
eukprot:761900-Hanusia_phi.AAC.1